MHYYLCWTWPGCTDRVRTYLGNVMFGTLPLPFKSVPWPAIVCYSKSVKFQRRKGWHIATVSYLNSAKKITEQLKFQRRKGWHIATMSYLNSAKKYSAAVIFLQTETQFKVPKQLERRGKFALIIITNIWKCTKGINITGRWHKCTLQNMDPAITSSNHYIDPLPSRNPANRPTTTLLHCYTLHFSPSF